MHVSGPMVSALYSSLAACNILVLVVLIFVKGSEV